VPVSGGEAVLVALIPTVFIAGILTGVGATFMALWWLRPPRKQ
jgi:hypothetical protein